MSERRRRFDSDLLLLLFIPACGIASLLVAFLIALTLPVVVLPAVAENNPAPTLTRTAIIPITTPTRFVPPTVTPAPLTPSSTPAPLTPTNIFTATPTEIPLNGIQSLAIYASTGNLWVTNNLGNSVAELSVKDPSFVVTLLRDIPSPSDIAIWQAKGLAYVTNPSVDTVTEIDLESRRVTSAFKIGGSPLGIAVDETTGDVYVTKAKSNSIAIISNKTRNVTQLDWKYSANQIAWTGQTGSFVVDNLDGVVQFITKGTQISDPIKVDLGLDHIAVHSFPIIGAAANFPAVGFYFTSSNKRVHFLYANQQRNKPLIYAPRAIADFGKCVGVVIPQNNTLVTLDFSLTTETSTYAVGAQGLDGGNGLAYNPKLDVAYIANRAANSIIAISKPCPLTTPTPTPRIIPLIPIPFFVDIPTITPTAIP